MALKFNVFTGNFDIDNDGAATIIDAATKLKIQRIANEDILAGEVLRAVSSTAVGLATGDSTKEQAQVIGIAENNALATETVDVILLGVVTDADFAIFSVNDQLFLDVDGAITNVKRTSGFHVPVGVALGGSDILFERTQPTVIA